MAQVAELTDRHEADLRKATPEQTGTPTSGWDKAGVSSHPDRPAADDIKLPEDRRVHILDGDGPGKPGGGHRHGTGRPGKTEFPASWGDEKIVSIVTDVARNPDTVAWQNFNSRWRAAGEREGVVVTGIVRPDGNIWSAWPEPGGTGVVQNAKA
jgi:Bacterial EndoU nuclease